MQQHNHHDAGHQDHMMIDQDHDHAHGQFHQQQQQQQRRSGQQQAAAAPAAAVRVWPPVRSSPIAIAPAEAEDARMADDSSSSDEDEEDRNKPQEAMAVASDDGEPGQPRPQPSQRNSSDEATSSSSNNTPGSSSNNNNNFTNSLPSRLLRAPMLGSLPSGGWATLPDTALPPPMVGDPPVSLMDEAPGSVSRPSEMARSLLTTTATAAAKTSYGSLRDSHLQGRFMDGPSSYRDGRTGDIHRIQQNRVRFGGAPSSYGGVGGGMSIGDRMRAQTQRNKTAAASKMEFKVEQTRQQQPQPSSDAGGASTLSKLMKESSDSENNNNNSTEAAPGSLNPTQQQQPAPFLLNGGGGETTTRAANTATFYDNDENSQDDEFNASALPAHALSTSLTGLEILQRGVFHQSQNPTIHNNNNNNNNTTATISNRQSRLFEEEELPRDANGHNALLARSYSDPTGHSQWRTQPQRASSQSLRPSPLLPPLTLEGSGDNPRSIVAALRSQGEQQHQQQQVMFLLPPANSQSRQQQQQPQPQSLLSSAMNGASASHQPALQQQSLLSSALNGASASVGHGSEQLAAPPPLDQSEENPDTEAAFQLDF